MPPEVTDHFTVAVSPMNASARLNTELHTRLPVGLTYSLFNGVARSCISIQVHSASVLS